MKLQTRNRDLGYNNRGRLKALCGESSRPRNQILIEGYARRRRNRHGPGIRRRRAGSEIRILLGDMAPSNPLNPQPVRENNASSDTHTKTSRHENPKDPNVPLALGVPATPPPEAKYEIACKPEKDFWDKVKTKAELVGIVLLALYTFYTIKMYCANKEAADAAKSAAYTGVMSLESSDRPWIAVESLTAGQLYYPDTGRPPTFSFLAELVNVGHSPASVHVSASVIREVYDPQHTYTWLRMGAEKECDVGKDKSRPWTVIPGLPWLYTISAEAVGTKKGDRFIPVLVGCAIYASTGATKTLRQTPFSAYLSMKTGPGGDVAGYLHPIPILFNGHKFSIQSGQIISLGVLTVGNVN